MAQLNEQIWTYCGPVFRFEKICTDNWKATTTASSKQKALSNLSFRAKKQLGLEARSVIKLDPNCLKNESI